MKKLFTLLTMLVLGISGMWADDVIKLYTGTAISSDDVASGYYVIKSKSEQYSETPYLYSNNGSLSLVAESDINGNRRTLWKIAYKASATNNDTQSSEYYLLNVGDAKYLTQGPAVPTGSSKRCYWLNKIDDGIYQMGLSKSVSGVTYTAIGATSATSFNRTSSGDVTYFELIPVTPFQAASTIDDVNNWYHIKGQKNNYITYKGTETLSADVSTVGRGLYSLWGFVQNDDGSYGIYSMLDKTKMWGAYNVTTGNTSGSIKLATSSDESAVTNFTILPTYANFPYMAFRINTDVSTTAYVNQISGSSLGSWNNNQAIYGWGKNASADITGNGDNGSGYAIYEVDNDDVNNYAVAYDEYSMNGRYSDSRYLNKVSVRINDNTSSVELNPNQGSSNPMYYDKTTTKFVVNSGDEVQFIVDYPGSWMHAYAYVDWNKDKQFDVNLTGNGPFVSGDGNELVSYSYYNNYNDQGQNAVSGPQTFEMGSFSVPESLEPGDYRARVKVDWDNIQPEGANDIKSNGGCIVDFILTIPEPSERTVNFTFTETTTNTTFTGSFEAAAQVTPTITGIDGIQFSNESWEDGANYTWNYTANITFPFVVSSTESKNYTYLKTEAMSSGICYFYTNGEKVVTKSTDDGNNGTYLPTNKTGENEKWMWAIVPSNSNLDFSVKLYNASTEKYVIKPDVTTGNPSATLGNIGAQFGYGTCIGNGKGLYLVDDPDVFFSANSSAAGEQDAILWTKTGDSNVGANLKFETPADFTTLINNLSEAKTKADGYRGLIGDGLNKCSANESYSTTYTQAGLILADASTTYATAAQITSYTNILNNNTGLSTNMPANGFYRFTSQNNSSQKGNVGKYLHNSLYNGGLALNTTKDESTIFYIDRTNNAILSYADGKYLNDYNVEPSVGIVNNWTIEEGSEIGKYAIKMGSTWYVSDWNTTAKITYGLKDANALWAIEPVDELPLTLAADSYTSFSAPVPVTIPEGEDPAFYAYIATSSGDGVINMQKVTGDVAANTGLIISTYGREANPSFDIAADGDIPSGNMLKPNWAASKVSVDNYFFAKVNGKYMFTKVTGDGTNYTLPGHKAYLDGTKLAGTGARISINWDIDNPTGIDELKNDGIVLKDGKYYQNGKVVVVRNGVKYNVAGQIIK